MPKVAVKTNRGFMKLRYGIHVAAILSTIVISCVNYTNVFWAGEESSNISAQIGAFQFVARLHESLLVTSLTTIVSDRVRQELLSSDGIPAGHLLAAQQIQLINFLFSKEFWKSMRAYQTNLVNSRLPLGFLLMLAAPFILVSGPLSAILLVPRLDWGSPMPGGLVLLNWNISAAHFWPTEVSASIVPVKCKTSSAANSSSCPASTFKPLVQWMGTLESLTDNGNITMTTTSQVKRFVSIQQQDGPSMALASTLSSRIFDDFALYWNRKTMAEGAHHKESLQDTIHQKITGYFRGNTELLKPLVRSECHVLNVSDDDAINLAGSKDSRNILLKSVNLSHVDWNRPTFSWIDGASQEGKPALAGIYTYSLNGTMLADYDRLDCDFRCKRIRVCPIEASWVPVKAWFDSQNANVIYQDAPNFQAFKNGLAGKGRAIVIRKDWADLLTIALSDQLVTDMTFSKIGLPHGFTYIEAMMWSYEFGIITGPEVQSDTTHNTSISRREWKRLMQQRGLSRIQYNKHKRRKLGIDILPESGDPSCIGVLPRILSIFMTEALSRLHSDDVSAFWKEPYDGEHGPPEDQYYGNTSYLDANSRSSLIAARSTGFKHGEWMQLDFRVQRYGWGWLTNSITVHIALAMLLSHAALTLVYLIFAFRSKNVPVAWGRVSELLILALNSLPSKTLANTSAGVDKGATWREMVKVREVDDGNRLSLVVAGDFEHGARVSYRPQVGKKYE
ncbi:MAG: hypothetical protein Q9160_006546 [Pyrenula sp. 1 TL-2023]